MIAGGTHGRHRPELARDRHRPESHRRPGAEEVWLLDRLQRGRVLAATPAAGFTTEPMRAARSRGIQDEECKDDDRTGKGAEHSVATFHPKWEVCGVPLREMNRKCVLAAGLEAA